MKGPALVGGGRSIAATMLALYGLPIEMGKGYAMFTMNALQLFGLIAAVAFIGALVGFFAASILAAGGRSSDEEERQEWQGENKR